MIIYLNDCGHLLGEDVKQFDLSRNTWTIFSMGEQSQSKTNMRSEPLIYDQDRLCSSTFNDNR